jgi:hypothetical protein
VFRRRPDPPLSNSWPGACPRNSPPLRPATVRALDDPHPLRRKSTPLGGTRLNTRRCEGEYVNRVGPRLYLPFRETFDCDSFPRIAVIAPQAMRPPSHHGCPLPELSAVKRESRERLGRSPAREAHQLKWTAPIA